MTYKAIIVGAGPIGIEMATVLKRADVPYLHLESGPVGRTITKWPRNTRFFSSPVWVAIAGIPIHTEGQEIVTGEHYLSYLRHLVEIFDLDIRTYETVVKVEGERGDFVVLSSDLAGREHSYHAENIVLATGDMNKPRTINIPGENLPHVTHYWKDPHLYFQRSLLIVGGRNSAVEAAIRCWRAGVNVSISYRGKSLDEKRLISRLHLEIDLLVKNGQIAFYPESEPVLIEPGAVRLQSVSTEDKWSSSSGDAVQTLPFDFVYLATGFEMDQTLYRQLGVALEGEEQQPVHNPGTMESNVPGVYVIGTSTGGNQRGYKVFITTSHEHCTKAARAIVPDIEVRDEWVGNHNRRDYPLSSKDVE
ncbi:MAG: NAD(P)-binding domain-containing protein [Spirochaetales bacterium]